MSRGTKKHKGNFAQRGLWSTLQQNCVMSEGDKEGRHSETSKNKMDVMSKYQKPIACQSETQKGKVQAA